MTTSRVNENLLFDYRTLRLIIGAIALSFPWVVLLLADKITTSISASYYTDAQNVFVGFLFIIGALLISYKGFDQKTAGADGNTFGQRLLRYQEDIVSSIGGVAAFVVALFPTSCDKCDLDTIGKIHYGAAFVLFSAVVYFCLVAFLRRLNTKMLAYEELRGSEDLMRAISMIQGIAPGASRFWKKLGNFLFRQPLIFICITREVARQKGLTRAAMHGARAGVILSRTQEVMTGYGKKLTRGYVYLGCGLFIAVILLSLVFAFIFLPEPTKTFNLTFWAETFSLWAFGAAWITASKLPFLRKIRLFLKLRRRAKAMVQQPAS